MKKILFLFVLLSTVKGFSQAITVNPNLTPAQLVNNVLVENSCLVQTGNYVTSTGSNFGSSNGIASYQNTNPMFPVSSSGLLLTTGQATASPGPNNTILSNGGASATWLGNAELQAALAAAGINMTSKNATLFQFDFIPNSTTFGLDFLFASEEYGQFQCTSNDAFVVLLDNLDDAAPAVNMALVPSTNNPITVSQIRNILYSSDCPSLNDNYFGVFNGGSNAATASINYNGQTKLMHIGGALVPNAHYRIKFIIADDARETGTDGNYDSAVFIPAGSLNLGQQVFTTDFTAGNGNPLCFGQEYVLNTNLDPAIYDFEWKRGTTTLPETGPALTIDEEGTYSVTLTRADLNCVTTESIVVEYAPAIPAGQPQNLFRCENPSNSYQYDLSVNTPLVKEGLDPNTVVTYHASQQNAIDDAGPLPTLYTSGSGVAIWVRAESPDSGCYALRSFQLLTTPPPTATQPANLVLCENAQGSNTATFNLNQQDATILGNQPIAENTITYYTSSGAANAGSPSIAAPASFDGTNQTIWARIEKAFDPQCFSVTSFNLVVNPLPVLPASAVINACDSYTLPALTTGAYFTGIGGTGNPLAEGTVLTASQTVYVYAQSGGTPNCVNQSELTINIINGATAPADVTACQSYELPPLNPGEEYHYQPGGADPAVPAGTIITTTRTIYFFIPANAACTQNNSFVVTITTQPTVTELPDVTQCTPYILPPLPNGQRYRGGPNNTGPQFPPGTEISTPQTVYIYASNPSNPDCTAQSDFYVNVNIVDVPDFENVSACNSYTLPSLPGGHYFTAPGGPAGGGTQYNPSQTINTTMTLYAYKQGSTNPACTDEDSFTVTINPLPSLVIIPDITVCNSYTLPAPPANAQFYAGPMGTGGVLAQGTVITSTQTVYVFTEPNEFGCRRQRSFDVNIINLDAVEVNDVTACVTYTLPALQLGNYFTGPNGSGNQLAPGTVLTSTQVVYVYISTNTTPSCTFQDSFTVTIKPQPTLAEIPNVVACGSYTLPNLVVSNGTAAYYTGPNGTGTMIASGSSITTSQTIYAYAQSGGTPNCRRQRIFTVTIVQNGSLVPPTLTACGSYSLPALTAGGYFTAPNGQGSSIPVGTIINTSQTIYAFAPVTNGPNCTSDDSMAITINPPVTVDDPADVLTCTPYELPPLNNGDYYTQSGGQGQMLSAGTIITDSQTIYVYESVPNTANCTAENSFTVTIETVDVQDLPDQTVCEGYVLPELPNGGGYYTETNGGGQHLNPGDLISSTDTIYIFDQTNTTPPCTDEENFVITVLPAPAIDMLPNVGSCGPYTLPTLTNGEYFTGSGGSGQQLFPGQVITNTQTIWIFGQTGGTPNCIAEHPFTVVINPAAPADVSVCGQYVLPQPEVGDYFTQPGGQGTPLPVGHVITTTQDVYVYVDLGPGVNCTDNNKFTVTITPYPVLDPVADVAICDNYELPALSVGDYYTGAGGTGQHLDAGDFITSTQTIYVYAETGGTPNCSVESSFLVTIYNTPLIDARSDVLACESYELDPLIAGQYFASPGGVDPLPEGYLVTNTMTVYIYAETGTNPNCPAENSFLVEVFHTNPDQLNDVVQCDTFTLPVLTEGKYYAQTGGPVINDPAANPEIPAGTVLNAPYDAELYIYSQAGGDRINCNSETSFHVNLYETPAVDDTQGDVAQCTPFALPQLNVGTYYTAPNGPFGSGVALAEGFEVTTPRTIYVYAASDPNGLCFDEHSFFVDVNIVTVPEYPDVIACGQYILPPLAASQGNYYLGPNGTGVQLNPGDVVSGIGDNTIYIYKQAGTTVICSAQSEFNVRIIEAPVPLPTDPVVVCAIDDVGHGIFDLQSAMAQMLGNQQNANITVHETLLNAQFDENPLSGDINVLPNYLAYRNTVAFNQTLYVRLESTLTDCYNVGEIQLIVNPRPIATTPEPYEMCDNGSNDTDGLAVFDLTTLEAEILGALSPANFTVTFYNNMGFIATPATYNSASDTIIGRVTNNATGCFDEVDVELIVNPLPVANDPTPYTLCDLNDPGNEREVFDLTTKIPEIIGTQDGINVTFFHIYDDAVAGMGASQILNPETYTNGATVETIFVRVEIEETGCYRIVLLDVRVEPVPMLDMPTLDELTVCDENGTGYGVFDLNELVEDMVDGATGYNVTFHVTYQDALDGNNPITEDLSNYHNVIADSQTLYIRVENTITGCIRQEPYAITLIVERAPQAPDLEDLVQCDDEDNNGQNGQAIFDLTVQDAIIHAALGTTPATLNIEYFVTETAARNGFPRITNPTLYNGTHEQTIWVRVETPATECFSVTSFQLILDRPLALTTPTILALCNESLTPGGNDGMTEFDLTVKDEEILGPFGIGQGMTVTYFVTNPQTDPAATPIADPTAFTNPAPPAGNPMTLYVMVTTPEGCKSYTTLTIKVLPLPEPDTTPTPLVACDDNSSPDGMEVFNLNDAIADIRDGDTTMVITFYETEQDAIDKTSPIPNPANYNTGSTTVWVRAEANTGNASDPVCFQVVALEIIVNMLPELGTAGVIDPYAICELNTDGIATFDFNTHLDEILGTTVNPDDYTVRFYANAANMPNGPAMPYVYTNTSSPNQQNIWVWVRNDVTGCINTAPLTLLVEEAAVANPITTTFFECDYDGTNDGLFTFDMTVVEPEVLGGQNPATYSVKYYRSLEDATDEVNPITTPSAYHSETPDNQTIWVRVTNESTVSRCHDITTLDLFVERIPEPALTTDHTTVCIDFETNQPVRFATIDSGLDATHTFQWFHNGGIMAGETGPTITVGEPGNYTVIATSATGCISDPIADLVIEKSGPASPIGVGYVVGNPFGENQIITVLVQGYGQYQYSLDNGPWQNSNVFENVSAYPVSDTQLGHIVHVRDIATADPCDDLNLILDLEGVSPIDYPNFFTPNGDGIHDTWQPFGLYNQNAEIYIFDRYGKLLKQISSSDESDGWDGTFNGNPVPADDYWFTIKYVIGTQVREFKGHFALKR